MSQQPGARLAVRDLAHGAASESPTAAGGALTGTPNADAGVPNADAGASNGAADASNGAAGAFNGAAGASNGAAGASNGGPQEDGAGDGPHRPASRRPGASDPTSPAGPHPAAAETHHLAGPGEPAPSWEEIAEQYGGVVYTMAFRLTGDRDEARDLAQDVFVRVYRNLDRYRPGTFEGWLYRITKNLFLDRVRRRKRVRLEPLPEEEWRQPSDLTPGPAERIDAGMLRGDLEQALRELPPLFRTAVVLCDVQGLSYEEVAQATGWPLGTVRSRIHRGRRLLRRRLGGTHRG